MTPKNVSGVQTKRPRRIVNSIFAGAMTSMS